MPQPNPEGTCWKFERCGEVDRIAPEVPPNGKVQPPKMTRDAVLCYCLMLNDVDLSWVCQSILAQRTCVVEKVMTEAGMVKEEKKQPLTGNSPGQVRYADEPKVILAEPVAPQDGGKAELPVDLPVSLPKGFQMPADGEPESPISPQKSVASFSTDFLMDATDEHESDRLLESFLSRDVKAYGEPPPDLVPVIQFLASMSYCKEEDPTVEVCIVRIGDLSKRSCAKYETRDLSAKAGIKYTAMSGKLVFQPGERMQFIYIPTTNDESWDATLEFEVLLLDEGLENAQLGRYLFTTRVKILDDDAFPTNRFKEQIQAGQLRKVSTPLLMWEYFKMNYKNKVVRRGLRRQVLCEQLENVYFVMCLFLDLWMVDYVLCPECDLSNASMKLYMIMVLRTVPAIFIHFAEFRSKYWKVGGASRMTLQSNLLRKYLAYDEVSLAKIDPSKLILAMQRDAGDIVQDAFCKIPKLISCSIKLLLLLVYQVVTPIALGDGLKMKVLVQRFVPVLLFPIVMITFLKLRNPRTLHYLEEQKRLQNDMLLHIRQTIENFSIIRDYRKRGQYVDMFVKKVAAFNNGFTESAAIKVNNQQFSKWVALIVCVAYTGYGGQQVADGAPLGAFLNNLAVYGALGDMWGQIYDVLLDMQNVFDGLTTVVEYLNFPTETIHRMVQYEQNMKCFRQSLDGAAKSDKWKGLDPVDQCRVELRGLSFRYKSKGSISSGLPASSVNIVQGGFYALVGPPSQGKGTVLKLCGEVLIPYHPGFDRNCEGGGGDLVIPQHLRALHVCAEPSYLEGSLFFNLTFGCGKKTTDNRMERVLNICKRLKMADYIIESVKNEEVHEFEWGQLLSSTDSALINVARALITNPEILCIHKPALYLNNEMAKTMYGSLRDHVSSRGLEQDPAEFYHRRPRTCITTSRRAEGPILLVSDAVYYVTQREGVKLIMHE